jgi:hypothetical protein
MTPQHIVAAECERLRREVELWRRVVADLPTWTGTIESRRRASARLRVALSALHAERVALLDDVAKETPPKNVIIPGI